MLQGGVLHQRKAVFSRFSGFLKQVAPRNTNIQVLTRLSNNFLDAYQLIHIDLNVRFLFSLRDIKLIFNYGDSVLYTCNRLKRGRGIFSVTFSFDSFITKCVSIMAIVLDCEGDLDRNPGWKIFKVGAVHYLFCSVFIVRVFCIPRSTFFTMELIFKDISYFSFMSYKYNRLRF